MTKPPDQEVGERSRLRLLQLTALISTCDRFAIAPLLVVIGIGLDEPLAAVVGVASAYYLAYGLMQPVWGVVSDRIGRVRVMRVSLLGAALSGVVSALAPDLLVLGLSRTVAGGCFAALIPATLVYVGDMWPPAVRQRPLSDVLAASSLGTAVATAGAGALADVIGWRSVPAITGAAAVLLWVALRRLPEPGGAAGGERPAAAKPVHAIATVLRTRWAVVVLAIVFVEGAVVLGILTYLAPAVQALGSSAAVAGLVAAMFGVGAVLWSQLVRRLIGRLTPTALCAAGGVLLLAAWALPSIGVNGATVTVAGLLLGGTWAFLHSTLQAWATEVVPGERASMVALFATLLFLGGAAGTAAAAPLADAGAFATVFRWSLAVAVPLVVAIVVARHRYDSGSDRTTGG